VPNTEAQLPCRTKLQPSLSYILGKHLAKHDLGAALHPVFWGQSWKLYCRTDSCHSGMILCWKHGSVNRQWTYLFYSVIF